MYAGTRSTWGIKLSVRPIFLSKRVGTEPPPVMRSKVQDFILEHIVVDSSLDNPPSLLDRSPERPIASARVHELKMLAEEVEKCDIEEVVGTPSAVLAVSEDPHARGLKTLLVEAGEI